MICKNCGEYNPSDALYCKKCGKKLSLDRCPVCGAEVADGAQFCVYCGAGLNADIQWQAASAAESAKNNNAAQENVGVVAENVKNSGITRKKVLGIISVSLALALAILTTIFVFLVGVQAKALVASNVYVNTSKNYYIYYFFGTIYSELEQSLNVLTPSLFAVASNYKAYKTLSYLPAVFGTIISALMLLAVLTVSIIAIVQCAKKLTSGKDDGGIKLAIFAYAVYLAGALSLLALLNGNVGVYSAISGTGSSMNATSAKISLNGITIAGIIIGGLLALGSVGCAVAIRGKGAFTSRTIPPFVINAVKIILLLVVLFLSAGAVIMLQVPSDASSAVSSNFYVSVSPIYMLSINSSLLFSEITPEQASSMNISSVFACFSYFATAAGLFVGALLLAKSLSYVKDDYNDNSRGLILAITFAVTEIINLIFIIVSINAYCDIYGDTGELSNMFKYPAVIACVVLSVLALSAEIVLNVMRYLKGKKAQ